MAFWILYCKESLARAWQSSPIVASLREPESKNWEEVFHSTITKNFFAGPTVTLGLTWPYESWPNVALRASSGLPYRVLIGPSKNTLQAYKGFGGLAHASPHIAFTLTLYPQPWTPFRLVPDSGTSQKSSQGVSDGPIIFDLCQTFGTSQGTQR